MVFQMVIIGQKEMINTSNAIGLFLYLGKVVFRGYKNRRMAWYGYDTLNHFVEVQIKTIY